VLPGRPSSQPVPGRLRRWGHPAHRGGRARGRGHRHRPGRQLPAGPDRYAQLTDLTALLRDRGLTEHHVKQVLGGNAASLLRRTIHW